MIMDSSGDQRVAYLFKQYSFKTASEEEIDEFLDWVMGLKGDELAAWYVERLWKECPLVAIRTELELPDWDKMMRAIVGAPVVLFRMIKRTLGFV